LPAEEQIIVDGSGMILGRLCSGVAKLLLRGKQVAVVNAERVMITGRKDMVIRERLETLKIASVVHPKYGPFHPRTPEGIVTRTVRGMLPMRKPKGVEAFKRLRVYSSVPERLRGKPAMELDGKASKPLASYLTVGDVAGRMGWRRGGV